MMFKGALAFVRPRKRIFIGKHAVSPCIDFFLGWFPVYVKKFHDILFFEIKFKTNLFYTVK